MGITDILIICQLHSFVMGEQHALNMFVLQAVLILFSWNNSFIPYTHTYRHRHSEGLPPRVPNWGTKWCKIDKKWEKIYERLRNFLILPPWGCESGYRPANLTPITLILCCKAHELCIHHGNYLIDCSQYLGYNQFNDHLSSCIKIRPVFNICVFCLIFRWNLDNKRGIKIGSKNR